MPLKSIMVECFNCNSKPCARFDWSSSILLNPSLENATKATLTKKALWSKVPCCMLKIVESELSQLGGNFQLLRFFRSWWITLCIASGSRWDYSSSWLVSAYFICRFTFCYSIHKSKMDNFRSGSKWIVHTQWEKNPEFLWHYQFIVNW